MTRLWPTSRNRRLVMLRDVLEERAGHLRAAHVEVLQVLPVLQVGDPLVRDGFRVIQVEDLHVLQRGQVLQAQVRDLRIGQVDALAAAAGAPASRGRRPSPRRCSGRRRSISPGGIAGTTAAERRRSRRRDRPRPRRPAGPRPRRARRATSTIMHSNHDRSCSHPGSPIRCPARPISFDGAWDRSISGSKMISHSGTASRTCRCPCSVKNVW